MKSGMVERLMLVTLEFLEANSISRRVIEIENSIVKRLIDVIS